MSNKYTINNIVSRIEAWMNSDKGKWGYACPAISSYHSLDADQCCRRIIEWLTRDAGDGKTNLLHTLQKLPTISTPPVYFLNGRHCGKITSEKTDQMEKNIAKALFRLHKEKSDAIRICQEGADIGRIIDYETPTIRGKKRNIDLLSVSRDGKTLYLLELKKNKSSENIIRCLLEAFSYSLLLHRNMLIDNLRECNLLHQKEIQICICPLIFNDGVAYDDYCKRSELITNLTDALHNVDKLLKEELLVRFDTAILDVKSLKCLLDEKDHKWFK